MLSVLDNFRIEKITEIMDGRYDSGEILEDLNKSIFIAIPKQAGGNGCELHNAISLMSHITKDYNYNEQDSTELDQKQGTDIVALFKTPEQEILPL